MELDSLTLNPSYSPGRTEHIDTHIEIGSPIDIREREYRERLRPSYQTTVDGNYRPQYQSEDIRANEYTVEDRPVQPSRHEEVRITEETVEPARYSRAEQKSNMGYYDEDGTWQNPLCMLPVQAIASRTTHT